eukprot:6177359-Pleurochrysis_carterae.AAC.2
MRQERHAHAPVSNAKKHAWAQGDSRTCTHEHVSEVCARARADGARTGTSAVQARTRSRTVARTYETPH